MWAASGHAVSRYANKVGMSWRQRKWPSGNAL
jgi:hypothetical protein